MIGKDKESTLHIETDAGTLKLVPEKLAQVAEAKALIAWLREAIKAKEHLTNEAKAPSLKDYRKSHHLEQPKVPKHELNLTEEDIIAITQRRARIYTRNRTHQKK